MDLLFRISWAAREKALYHTPPSKTQLTPAFFLSPRIPVKEPARHLLLCTFFSTWPFEISKHLFLSPRASQVVLVVKNLHANASAGDIRDAGSVPVWERSHREGNGHPLQYSCLGNPTDRGAWWAAVHGVAQSRSLLKRLSTHAPRGHSWERESSGFALEECRNHLIIPVPFQGVSLCHVQWLIKEVKWSLIQKQILSYVFRQIT